MRFSIIYGHRWTSIYPDAAARELAKREWALALNHVTVNQIAKGVEHCRRHSKWPPSIPEFVEHCEDWQSILPNSNEAYQEACRASYPYQEHEWSHPAVYHAAKSVGFYELRTGSSKNIRNIFDRAYEVATRRVKNGEDLTAPIPKAISHQRQLNKRNLEYGQKMIAEIHSILNSKCKPEVQK